MSQKSSVPQAASFVSVVLKRDRKQSSVSEFQKRVNADFQDHLDEDMELELDDDRIADPLSGPCSCRRPKASTPLLLQGTFAPAARAHQAAGLDRRKKLKIVVLFEGRDAAGKGGVIKRITQRLNPRVCRVVALPAPTERERTPVVFPALRPASAGGRRDRAVRPQLVQPRRRRARDGLLHRRGVRGVLSLRSGIRAPAGRSGIILIKYWFSITDDEQHLRFLMRIHDPMKQWKLSPMDLESRRRWELYTKAKEAMLERTHIPEAPWCSSRPTTRSARGSTASPIS